MTELYKTMILLLHDAHSELYVVLGNQYSMLN